MDVKTAFLNGSLDESIYMMQPGVYKRCNGNAVVFLVLYVDDILLIGNDMGLLSSVRVWLSSQFDMKDLGEASHILGIKLMRDRKNRMLGLSQATYIDTILSRFSMQDSKKGFLPFRHGITLSKDQCPKTPDEIEKMKAVPYASAVGSLMPDLAHAVGMVSRYMSNPGKEHWNAVKWVLRYLQGTKSLGIVFERKDGADSVAGFVDSDYAGDLDKRRSTTGYVFTLASGPVSWRSMLQATSALSTTEAEYMALTEASKEASILLRCDSQSALYLAKNQVYHARTKHIDVRYHRVRDWVNSGEVVLEKVNTDENAADMLTKPVTAEKFRHCLKLLNLTSC
ncbi:hypothetical protein LguiB_012393 [Lonicera macranthoides]